MTPVTTPGANPKGHAVNSLARITPRAIRTLVGLSALVFGACSDKGAGVILVETEAKPERLEATATVLQGQGQQGEVGAFLTSPLTVEVKDGAGMPMRGMTAVWTFSSGGGAEAGSVGGQVSQSLTTATDNQGKTSVAWRMGTKAGVQTASVSISTNSNGKGKTVDVSIEATALAGPASQLTLDPANLVVPVRGMKTLKAIASDRYGNAVSAGQITWSSSDGSIAQVDANGNVTGNAAGHTTITALDGSAAAAASVDVENVVSTSSLSVTGGNGQTGTSGEPLAQSPSVHVVDTNGNAVTGATVAWSVTSGGGSVSSSSTSTDAQGNTSVQWTLGPTTGQQTMTATLNDASVEFIATAEGGQVTDPATVGDLQVVGVTSGSVTLRWTQVQNGAGSAADYAVRSGSPTLDWAAAGAGQVAVTGTSAGSTIDYTWTGLTAGTAYQFGVAATRTDGGSLVYGTPSNFVGAFTTPSSTSEPTDPERVTDLQVVGLTSSSVTLRWTEVDDGAGHPAKYAIRYGSPSLDWGLAYATEVSVSGSSIGASRQYTFSGLSAGTSYQFGLVSYRGTLDVDAVFGSLSNFTSATTSAGTSTPTVASVVASPSSKTLIGVGASAQLSGSAKDAYGNVVSGVTFNWQSLNPSVATVNGNGLVIAQALGTALIVVKASCCTPADTVTVSVQAVETPPPSGTFFSDGFESGDKSSSQNGFNWTGNPANVTVTSEHSRSGSHSLEFVFNGKSAGLDATAEQRFNLGRQVTEVWVEYYIYYPDGTEGLGARYEHRNDTGPDNNKFIRLWGADYNAKNKIGASTTPSGDTGSNLIVEYCRDEGAIGNYGSGGVSPFVDNAHRGRWVQFRMHAKMATGATAENGRMRIWWDGALAYDNASMDFFASGGMAFWDQGYLLGWANSGFDQTTSIFIDDVTFHVSNPGW